MSTPTYATEVERLLAERLNQVTTALDACEDELDRLQARALAADQALEKAIPVIAAAHDVVARYSRFGFGPSFQKLANAVRSAT